jgi:RHS repeat-associated protein
LDAYGNLLSEKGDSPNPFRLRGQYEDAETGLYYNFNRHYDPGLGDYTAPDPIGIAGGFHFYAYPRNPLRWDDPFGLTCPDDDPNKDKNHPEKANDDPNKPKAGGPPPLADPPEPPPPGTPAERDLKAEAEKARDDLAAKLKAEGKSPATVVGAYDEKTGNVTAAASGPPPDPVDPQIAAKAAPLGGIGTKTDCGNTVGCCAECRAANDLAQKGSNVNDVGFTDATRPRTGDVVPPCDNCKSMFGSKLPQTPPS